MFLVASGVFAHTFYYSIGTAMTLNTSTSRRYMFLL